MDKEKIMGICEKLLLEVAVVTLIRYVIKVIIGFIKKFTDKEHTIDELFEEQGENE